MTAGPLIAHSLAEAYLYLMATPCEDCGRGPLREIEARPLEQSDGQAGMSIDVRCASCNRGRTLFFALPLGTGTPSESGPATVNPGHEPSRILDLAQWLLLFRRITEAAGAETQKTQARELGLEAAQCLEEALKFYDDADNDLPPPESFFHPASRERFRDHPEQFSRQRLLDLRSKLPSVSVMRAKLESPPKPGKRFWWRRHE